MNEIQSFAKVAHFLLSKEGTAKLSLKFAFLKVFSPKDGVWETFLNRNNEYLLFIPKS